MKDDDVMKLDFNLPICGREAELSILKQAFDHATTNGLSRVVVRIYGSSGTGKSRLIDAFRNQVCKRCFFGSGKFHERQASASEPFAAISDALNEILASADDLQSIQKDLGSAVSPLSTILPELKEEAKKGKVISQRHSTNFDRLKLAARDFLRLVCTKTPVVLFLDDLQWAGSDSLDFVETLVRDTSSSNLLFIGAHREIEKDHPANRLFDANVTEIPLVSLSLETVEDFIARLLKKESEQVRSLADVVYRKTGGAPICVIQFLRYLEEKKYLFYSLSTFGWEWNLNAIQSRTSVSDNVVDMIVNRMQTMSASSQLALSVAACSGLARFDVDTLYSVIQVTPAYIHSCEGIPIGSTTQLRLILDAAVQDGLLEKLPPTTYKFAHDRILESALTLLPSGREKTLLHYRIGQELEKMSLTASDEVFISRKRLLLLGIRQLNLGSEYVEDPKELERLATLNLEAANIAIHMSAFFSAVEFLEIGIEYLKGDDPWEQHYELMIKLFTSLAEMYVCCGDLAESQSLAKTTLKHARTLKDKVGAYRVFVTCLFQQGNIKQAIELVLRILDQFGIPIRRRSLRLRVLLSTSRTRRLMRRMPDSDLLALPQIKHERLRMSLPFHTELGVLAYQVGDGMLASATILSGIHMTLQSGLSEYSCVGFALYSILLGRTGDIKGAFRFSKLALQLADESVLTIYKPHAIALAHLGSHHWMRPYYESLDPIYNAYKMTLEMGDVQHFFHRMAPYIVVYLCCGLRLAPLEKDIKKFLDILNDYSLRTHATTILPMWQMVLNLMGDAEDPLVLTGSAMNQARLIEEMIETKNEFALRTLYKARLTLACFFNDLPLAEEMISKIDPFEREAPTAILPVHEMFEGLVALSLARTTKKRKYRMIGKRKMKKLEKWVKSGAINCHYMLLIVQAEYFTLGRECDLIKVQELYDKAILTAARLGILHHQALANERAGRYFFGIGDMVRAETYLTRARDRYDEWDACGKARHMEKEYSFLNAPESNVYRHGSDFRSRTRFKSINGDRHRVLHY